MRRTVFATAALALVLPLAAQAQEWPPQPAKYTDVEWYEIVNFALAGPNIEAATDALIDVFIPALAASDNPIPATQIIPMKGPGDMEWDMTPEFVAILMAAVKDLGGSERMVELAAMKLGAMARVDSTIVPERKDGT